MKRTKPLRRTALKRVSKKRAKEMGQYKILRDAFMRSRPMCEGWLLLNGYSMQEIDSIQKTALITLWEGRHTPEVWAKSNEDMILLGLPQKCPRSDDCHHRLKRGKNYLNVDSWLAISRVCHELIHAAPSWARKVGLLA